MATPAPAPAPAPSPTTYYQPPTSQPQPKKVPEPSTLAALSLFGLSTIRLKKVNKKNDGCVSFGNIFKLSSLAKYGLRGDVHFSTHFFYSENYLGFLS
ncbi:PEP-CTERM sorting domain-containing protein [Nostoc piscinale]|uniref:PEP-CTERM sorting domain-containing protein n=1 Tax=Nostoc piscinale TaxID=224012 RepID=UPI0011875F3F